MTSLQIVKEDSQGTQIKTSSKFSYADFDRLVIHLADCIRIIPTDTIEFIQASSNYSVINLTDGTKLIISKTLKSISESLGDHFMKTHKSYVINLKYIEEYRLKDSQIIMESTKSVLVSRANKPLIRKVFDNG